jgi:hypothetical protein
MSLARISTSAAVGAFEAAENILQLRSRLASIFNIPHGKERVLARLGKVGGIRYASGAYFACGLIEGRFEQPLGSSKNLSEKKDRL